MKKFYAIIAAALMSVSVFAAKDVVPSDAVLAEYWTPGQVCMCFFVPADMNCFDIVVTGSFNGWSGDLAKCLPVEAVEGYDGWYVVAYDPEDEPDAEKGLQAKPVMKGGDGAFNWNYQIGAATVIRGSVEIVAGLPGEIDMIHYGTDAPNVFTVDEWKANPCTAVYHNYIVYVTNNLGCDGFAVPFLIGEMTGWEENFMQMQLDEERSAAVLKGVYKYSFKAREGAEYQIVCGLIDGTGAVVSKPGWNDDSYLQENIDGDWSRINGGANFTTGTDATIEYDWSDLTKFQWGRCKAKVEHTYTITAKLPTVEAPAQVEVRGGWRDADEEQGIKSSWDEGAIMTPGNTPGLWTVTIDAYEGCQFKFCSHAMGWAKQIQVYDSEGDTWKDADNQKFGSDEAVAIDFSDPDSYQWTPGEEQGIEDIVLTEKAQKVMVDGVLYIVRDNKMFNVQGAQVR
ncbi:MAG: hypothetical protein K6F10_02360 [Paludibacteraceae bacterium]|nr:hypothetical protein [Paludibacteraceae bacterium]